MSEESQKQSSGSKWGRAWTFVAPIGLWRMSRDTFKSLKDTVSTSTEAIRGVNEGRVVQRDWNQTVMAHGVTLDRIAREVARRQAMAFIAATFLLIGIYGVFAWNALLPGFGCAALSAIYYLQSVLRLHQIRHHQFISVGEYIARVKTTPRELLPLGLPKGWKLYSGV